MVADELDRVWRRRDDAVFRRVAGESLVIPVRGKLADMQRIFALNPLAEFVWERIDGVRSLADIARDVVEAYDVSAEEAGRDLAEFAGELAGAGLVDDATAEAGEAGR